MCSCVVSVSRTHIKHTKHTGDANVPSGKISFQVFLPPELFDQETHTPRATHTPCGLPLSLLESKSEDTRLNRDTDRDRGKDEKQTEKETDGDTTMSKDRETDRNSDKEKDRERERRVLFDDGCVYDTARDLGFEPFSLRVCFFSFVFCGCIVYVV